MEKIGAVVVIVAFALGSQLASAQPPETTKSPPPTASTAPTAQTQSPEAARKEIEQTFGFVPQFMKQLSGPALPMFWNAMKSLEMSSDTKLDAKTKALIGLAVAAQIPCQYCIEFHTEEAKANGASAEEIEEAVAVASVTRMGSTLLNGMQVDESQFRKDVDRMMKKNGRQASRK